MNKNLIYAIVGVVVVLGAVAFILHGSSSAPTAGTPDTSATNTGAVPAPTTAAPGTASSMTLQSLLSLGSAQKCTFTDATSATASSEGTVYVSSGKFRGDFTSVVAGKNIMSHMIVSANDAYVWTDLTPGGFKMALATIEKQQAPGANQGFDPNKKVNYSCSPWTVDAKVFALPTGIQFSNMTNILPNPPAPKTK